MTPTDLEQEINTMARDFTTVTPKSKSEVRSRIKALIAADREEAIELVKNRFIFMPEAWSTKEKVYTRIEVINIIDEVLAKLNEKGGE